MLGAITRRPHVVVGSVILSGMVTACNLGDLVQRPDEVVRLDCLVSELALDAVVPGVLDAESCPAPQAPARYAAFYRGTGRQHDSISITVTSAALAPRLAVLDSTDFRRIPVTETVQCSRLADAACVRHYVLTRDGPFGIVVSSAGDGETGAYTLTVTRPRPPQPPADLVQFGPDATPVPAGGELAKGTIALGGAVSDPDVLEHLRLDVEIRPLSEPFRQEATASNAPGAAGSSTVEVTGLESGTQYHWQARTVDETGRATVWIPYGGDGEHLADFRIAPAVTQLAFRVQPRTTPAGEPLSPALEVAALDAAGNVVTSFDGTITVGLAAGTGSDGASLKGGDLSVPAQNGVAIFRDLAIERSGTGYRLAAFASGVPAVLSDTFNILPGSASRLAFTVQPNNTGAGRTISPPVRVTALDAFGNVATGFRGTVNMGLGKNPSLGGLASLNGRKSVEAVDGVAVFDDLSVDTPGQGYTLLATGVGSSESTAFNVSVF